MSSKKPEDFTDKLYLDYSHSMLEKIDQLEKTSVKKEDCSLIKKEFVHRIERLESAVNKIEKEYMEKKEFKDKKADFDKNNNNIKDVLQNYSNSFVKINTVLENITETLSSINEQTAATNGRVKKLEMWQSGMIVGIVLIGMVSGYILNDYVTTRDNLLKLQEKVTIFGKQ